MKKTCTIRGCHKVHHARGYCKSHHIKHYLQFLHKNAHKPQGCSECGGVIFMKGLCHKHYKIDWKARKVANGEICITEGCGKAFTSRRHQLCEGCYRRQKNRGELKEIVERTEPTLEDLTCECRDCDCFVYKRGLCVEHYEQRFIYLTAWMMMWMKRVG